MLQGKQKILPMMLNDVAAFEAKPVLAATSGKKFHRTRLIFTQHSLFISQGTKRPVLLTLKPGLAFKENPFARVTQAPSVAVTSEHFSVETAASEDS